MSVPERLRILTQSAFWKMTEPLNIPDHFIFLIWHSFIFYASFASRIHHIATQNKMCRSSFAIIIMILHLRLCMLGQNKCNRDFSDCVCELRVQKSAFCSSVFWYFLPTDMAKLDYFSTVVILFSHIMFRRYCVSAIFPPQLHNKLLYNHSIDRWSSVGRYILCLRRCM